MEYVSFFIKVDLSFNLKFVLNSSKATHTAQVFLPRVTCTWSVLVLLMGKHFCFLSCQYSLIQMCKDINMHPHKFYLTCNVIRKYICFVDPNGQDSKSVSYTVRTVAGLGLKSRPAGTHGNLVLLPCERFVK